MPEPTTGDLPIVDYPHLPKQVIESRLPGLHREELEAVLRYECAHRRRTPLIRLLTARLRRLREGRTASRAAHRSPDTAARAA